MTFENKGDPPKGSKSLVCVGSQRHLNCDAPRWRYFHFETAFFAFVKEVELDSLLLTDDKAKQRSDIENSISALNGELSSVRQLRDKTFALLETDVATDYVSGKLVEIQDRIVELQSLLDEKRAIQEGLIEEDAAFSAAKLEIRVAIERLRSSSDDDVYKLRSQIAARLKSLIKRLEIGTAGHSGTIKRIISNLEKRKSANTARLDYLRRQLTDPANNRPYFWIVFKDDSQRYVVPDQNDPLQFHQQFIKRGAKTTLVQPNETTASATSTVTKISAKGADDFKGSADEKP